MTRTLDLLSALRCLFALGLAVGCAADVAAEPAWAGTVVEAPGAREGPFGDPALAVNGVRGAGSRAGGLDVFSLRPGEHLVLAWEGLRVTDGPGDDLVVFENAFEFGDDGTFMDPVVVEVSLDGERWIAFPHDYLAADEAAYSHRAADWVGFAGVAPVHLHAEDNPVDPYDPAAGGDRFDLADLGQGDDARAIRERGFAWLRLTPASDRVNPDTGEPFVRDAFSDGPDIDGVHARYPVLDPR